MFMFQPDYASLPAQERQALLEGGVCPASAQLQGCDDMKMNFAVDWDLLKPALSEALKNLQDQKSFRSTAGVQAALESTPTARHNI